MQLNNSKTKEIAQPTRERSAASTVAARHRTSEQHHSTNQRSTDGNRSRQLYILTACTSLLYALRVLRCHSIPDQSLKDVFQATVLAKITYCLPAWSGLRTAADRTRLNSFLRRCVKLGCYSSNDPPTLSSIADDVEDTLFSLQKHP